MQNASFPYAVVSTSVHRIKSNDVHDNPFQIKLWFLERKTLSRLR